MRTNHDDEHIEGNQSIVNESNRPHIRQDLERFVEKEKVEKTQEAYHIISYNIIFIRKDI